MKHTAVQRNYRPIPIRVLMLALSIKLPMGALANFVYPLLACVIALIVPVQYEYEPTRATRLILR